MSREKRSNLYLGVLFILAGVIVLVFNLGFEYELDETTWGLLLTIGSGLVIIGYLIGDWGRWWLLLPAAGLAVGALAIFLENREADSELIGGLTLAIMALPFWAAFLVDRVKNKWALIPGFLLIFIGLVLAFFSSSSGLFASLIMLAAAVTFLGIFFFNREQWWALIPAYVFLVIALIVLIAEEGPEELIGAFVLWSIALPFLVVFIVNRKNWWALIPAYVLGTLGFITIIAITGDAEWIGSLVLFTIALPFFFVYFRNQENWWALIPAGVLTSIGLAISLVFLGIADSLLERFIPGLILGGTAITFLVIWLHRKRTAAEWAVYPAAICGGAALLVLTLGIRLELLWGVVLIAIGGWILLRNRSRIQS